MSPIIGLTDSVRPAFPLLGKLRKGAAQGGRGPGRDLDHFRFTSDNPAIVRAFQEAYGSEPRAIPCVMPYADVEDNFTTWKEAWVAGGLQHRCDGQTCVIWLTDRGTYSREPVPCPGGCKQVGRLNLIVPELVRAGHVGYVTVETHSVNDLLNLQASLEAAAQLAPNGDLRGIRWVLRRVPERISTPAQNGGRARRESWMLKLTPDARWAQRQFELALSEGDSEMRQLPSGPAHVDVETGEIVDVSDDDAADDAVDAEYDEVEEPMEEAPPAFLEEEANRASVLEYLAGRGMTAENATEQVARWRKLGLTREKVRDAAKEFAAVGKQPVAPTAPAAVVDWDTVKLTIMKRKLPVRFRDLFVALAQASGWSQEQTMAQLGVWQTRYQEDADQALADMADMARMPDEGEASEG